MLGRMSCDLIRGCKSEWLSETDSCSVYVAEFWSVLKGLILVKGLEFRVLGLHKNSKMVGWNILDFEYGSIIGMWFGMTHSIFTQIRLKNTSLSFLLWVEYLCRWICQYIMWFKF